MFRLILLVLYLITFPSTEPPPEADGGSGWDPAG